MKRGADWERPYAQLLKQLRRIAPSERKYFYTKLVDVARAELSEGRFLTTAAAGRLAGVSGSTMLRAVKSRMVRYFCTTGGHYRLDPASVLKAFKKRSPK